MSLVFKRIRWKNFLSTGNNWTEINFEDVRTTLIIGQNGSGKSTLLDALCYVLYGKPFRKINIPQLINTINKKGLLVEVEFASGRDEFLVRRGLKPNVFEVEKNGVLVNQDAANRDYQEVLTKFILKMNFKAFCQVIILGSASFVPFMQLSAGHRREILEDLLDIQIFTTMNVLLKEKMNENSRDILEIDYKLDLAKEKIRIHEEHVKSLLSNTQEVVSEFKDKIKKLKNDIVKEESIIAEKNAALAPLISITKDYEKTSRKIEEMNKIEGKLIDKRERISREIDFFEHSQSCPTCKQTIDEDFKNHMVAERYSSVNEVKSALKELTSTLTSLNDSANFMHKTLTNVSSINADIHIRTNKIKSINSSISDLEEQIKKMQKKNETIVGEDSEFKNLEKELEQTIDEKKKMFELREVHRVASTVLKDSGIKAKIIKQYIPVINRLINKYLLAMDFFVQFELDENFNETIKSRFRDAFSYASFSEGEKSKIDLALLFTWRTIARLRNSASTNILILDEVFDGSLDAASSEELLKILIELSNDSNIFVISHRTDQLLDKFDRVIEFEKKSNFSGMVSKEREEV